jgi:hypothetical protein
VLFDALLGVLHDDISNAPVGYPGYHPYYRVGNLEHVSEFFTLHYIKMTFINYNPPCNRQINLAQFLTFCCIRRYSYSCTTYCCIFTALVYPVHLAYMGPLNSCGVQNTLCKQVYTISLANFAYCSRVLLSARFFVILPNKTARSPYYCLCLRYVCWFFCYSLFLLCQAFTFITIIIIIIIIIFINIIIIIIINIIIVIIIIIIILCIWLLLINKLAH